MNEIFLARFNVTAVSVRASHQIDEVFSSSFFSSDGISIHFDKFTPSRYDDFFVKLIQENCFCANLSKKGDFCCATHSNNVWVLIKTLPFSSCAPPNESYHADSHCSQCTKNDTDSQQKLCTFFSVWTQVPKVKAATRQIILNYLCRIN